MSVGDFLTAANIVVLATVAMISATKCKSRENSS